VKFKLLLCLALVLSGICHAAIVYPKAPEGGRKIVFEYAEGVFQIPSLFKGLRLEDLTIAAPCQLYSFNVTSGERLSAAKPGVGGGWEYPLLHGTNAVGIAYLEADEKTRKALECTELGEDNSWSYKLEALQIAERLPQVKKQDYEVRSLEMPWIEFCAVWLHGKSDDIIIPLPDAWKRWNGYQPCSEQQIIKILKPEEERNAAMCAKLNKQEQKRDTIYLKAMMDYEKAHGGKCGVITNYTASFQDAGSPGVWVGILNGKSSKGGILAYKVEVTCKDEPLSFVKRVKILEKITDNRP
jgi:hypothetical protein